MRMCEQLSTERLREFVLDFCEGHIYTTLDKRVMDNAHSVFMPLLFFSDEQKKQIDEEQDSIAFLYGNTKIHYVFPRSINGLPCFGAVSFMHVDDWKRIKPAIAAELERRKSFSI